MGSVESFVTIKLQPTGVDAGSQPDQLGSVVMPEQARPSLPGWKQPYSGAQLDPFRPGRSQFDRGNHGIAVGADGSQQSVRQASQPTLDTAGVDPRPVPLAGGCWDGAGLAKGVPRPPEHPRSAGRASQRRGPPSYGRDPVHVVLPQPAVPKWVTSGLTKNRSSFCS
jgi:hypothetical protein